MEHNDQVVLTPSALTRFHSRAPPGISVLDYLNRIVKYTNLEVRPASPGFQILLDRICYTHHDDTMITDWHDIFLGLAETPAPLTSWLH